jgi:hypothetical protein
MLNNNKYIHYYNGFNKRKSKPFNNLAKALESAHKISRFKKLEIIEVRPFSGQHNAVPFGLHHKNSIYVINTGNKIKYNFY